MKKEIADFPYNPFRRQSITFQIGPTIMGIRIFQQQYHKSKLLSYWTLILTLHDDNWTFYSNIMQHCLNAWEMHRKVMKVATARRIYRKHPGGILHLTGIWFDIAMVECTAIVHINFVIIFQMAHEIWNITNDWALWPRIRTIIRSKNALRFMFKLVVVRVDAHTSKTLIFTWELKGCSYLLQCKTSDITKFMPASWASVVHPRFATRA